MHNLVPAVAFIEMAIDTLKDRADAFIEAELHELGGLGDARTSAIEEARPHDTDFQRGYLLGIETARACLATNPAAITAKVIF